MTKLHQHSPYTHNHTLGWVVVALLAGVVLCALYRLLRIAMGGVG